MGSTIIEKILAKHAGKDKVEPGEFVIANIDVAMIPEGLLELHELAIKNGFKDGIPKIWNKEKVFTVFDHSSPLTNEITALRVKMSTEITQKKYGVKVYGVNEGICHQLMPEEGYVAPGSLIVGKDSHSTTYGAFNAAGIPIGASDMIYALATGKLWFKVPETIKFILKGELNKRVMAKDVFLYIAGKYTTEVAQYKAIEWAGPAVSRLSIDARMSLSEPSVELGAKCAIFEADDKTLNWLKGRVKESFTPVSPDPDATYESVIDVDITEIGPQVAKPHFVGNVVPVEEVEGVPIDQAFIGSCANGRLEDLHMAAEIVKGKKVHSGTRFIVTPASRDVYAKAAEDGTLAILAKAGALITNPGCGACTGVIGVLADGENAIAAAPRNFMGRMGSPKANIYLGSPATVAASAIYGVITDPRRVE